MTINKKIWFEHTTIVVKRGNILSSPVKLLTEVRQGSIWPVLFGVFVNKLLTDLSISGLGCHIRFILFNVFLFADDILIVAPSIRS